MHYFTCFIAIILLYRCVVGEEVACDMQLEKNTSTVCGDCTMLIRNTSGAYACSTCRYNIATHVHMQYPKPLLDWSSSGCSMFRIQYISKHPLLSTVLLLITTCVCTIVIYVLMLIVRYYKQPLPVVQLQQLLQEEQVASLSFNRCSKLDVDLLSKPPSSSVPL